MLAKLFSIPTDGAAPLGRWAGKSLQDPLFSANQPRHSAPGALTRHRRDGGLAPAQETRETVAVFDVDK